MAADYQKTGFCASQHPPTQTPPFTKGGVVSIEMIYRRRRGARGATTGLAGALTAGRGAGTTLLTATGRVIRNGKLAC